MKRNKNRKKTVDEITKEHKNNGRQWSGKRKE